ncbi:MAG: hypothetical protein DCC52_18590, partial [Chloroflexi bacterium]
QVADTIASEYPGRFEDLRVDSQRLRTGDVTEDQYVILARAMGELAQAHIYIDESSLVTPIEMRSKARRLSSELNGLDLIIIDYMQLMNDRGRTENRVQEMSNISRQLKFLAREMDVPVIAMSQLSRAVENRTDKRPQLSDLRESGSIEQDADVVVMLHREKTYYPTLEAWQSKRGSAPFRTRTIPKISRMSLSPNIGMARRVNSGCFLTKSAPSTAIWRRYRGAMDSVSIFAFRFQRATRFNRKAKIENRK